jgi:hypothetical protein
MANNNEFQSARLNGAVDDGADLVAQWANLEAAIRNAFGITADTDYSEAMQIATGPNITMTGTLTLRADPTTDLMAATKQYLQANATQFGAVAARMYLTSDQNIETWNTDYLEWDAADINEGSPWSASYPSRFTVPASQDGYYLFGVTAAYDVDAAGWDNHCKIDLQVNRGDRYTVHSNYWGEKDEFGACGQIVLASLSAGDYVEVLTEAGSGGTGVHQIFYSTDTTFFGMRVY